MLQWTEVYHVIGGSTRRATYRNVSPGSYIFRAIAATEDGEVTAELTLPITIEKPFWTKPWYWALVGVMAVTLVAGLLISLYQRRSRLRLRALRLQNALSEDRSRIARDMHDDLGTRVSVLSMYSGLVRQLFDSDPNASRKNLDRMDTASRSLVSAMDDLVWSVDPVNDTLEDFLDHITRTAGEIFGGSQVHCRLDLPTEIPEVALHSEQRHHLALIVKEACNNILRHAGPCEAKISLLFEKGVLEMTISDQGRGYDPADSADGNGLANLRDRAAELGGDIQFEVVVERGTTIHFSLKIEEVSAT